MKAILFIAFIIVYLTSRTVFSSNFNSDGQLHWWDTDNNKEISTSPHKRVPFPQCLFTGSNSRYIQSFRIDKLLEKALRAEENRLDNYENDKYHKSTYDDSDDDYEELRRGKSESLSTARAALKITGDLLTTLMCDMNGTKPESLQALLSKFNLPSELCSYLDKPDCSEKKDYRTITGVCNNLDKPYLGSSQTAFGRLLPAAYDDSLSEPRRKSRRGGLLPSCRKLSLNLGSSPVFNRNYNHLYVIFGQLIGHDVALSTPVTDVYGKQIWSCKCSDKYDWNRCTVIDIDADDPYLRGQRCMAFPATAPAFPNQICSLGVKQQSNKNTHFLDHSGLYGNTLRVAMALRAERGLMKTSRFQWSKYELPPGQREGKSCTDATQKRKCFAGGDSRLMVDLLLTGIHTMFLRFHNAIATNYGERFPSWSANKIYEETRKVNIALLQKITYEHWLPALIGPRVYTPIFNTTLGDPYNPTTTPEIFNEFATAVFRLHTLVRDLFSRCTYDAKRIDELWLHDILHKSKYAYDMENNGLDSIVCGSLYDHGFDFDSNFAHQIHNRLFETTNSYGQMWRNDLAAINICRGREHGIQDYAAYRELITGKKINSFDDFGDVINYNGLKKLKKLYYHHRDVDLFVGINFEDPVSDGIVGPTSAWIIAKQFQKLRDGDRHFYLRPGTLDPEQRNFIHNYPPHCLMCRTMDIEQVSKNPFKVPDEKYNPLQECSECPPLKINFGSAPPPQPPSPSPQPQPEPQPRPQPELEPEEEIPDGKMVDLGEY